MDRWTAGCVATALALAQCSSTDSVSSDAGASRDASPTDAATAIPESGDTDSGGADSVLDAATTDAPMGADGSPMTMNGDASTAGYPLQVGPSGRYLVDRGGHPFLMAGDAPQSLIVNLSESDADFYFADRQAHGFNTVWMDPPCDHYTGGRKDGTTYDGIAPFTTAGDLSTTNEAYFARVDDMLRLAAKYVIPKCDARPCRDGRVARHPRRERADQGPRVRSVRGKPLQGLRQHRLDERKRLSELADGFHYAAASAVALGIKDVDTRHIHTVASPDYNTSSSSDDPTWLPIIGLDAAYTYYPTYGQVLKSYDRASPLPVFLVEGVYEFESNVQGHQATTATLRRQEYWTNLSGATGQIDTATTTHGPSPAAGRECSIAPVRPRCLTCATSSRP